MHSFLAKDSNFIPREIEHCADPPEVSLGHLVEPTTCAGYEPKDLAGNEDFRVKPFFFHRPRKASTYDSAESIATHPPESGLDDEQIRALLASPLYQEQEANADRSQVYHSVRENLMIRWMI